MGKSIHLFERFGVELEYMIVDRETLDVRPASDELIRAVAGRYQGDIDFDDLSWSNELVLHVIELKTARPAVSLAGLAEAFQRHVQRIDGLLAPLNARLMPTAMHPWMDPLTQTRLWPHEYSAVYEAFDRIFDCRGHGWANLQCVHLNLPFAGDDEFARLHAAIRLVLPILPALAASSPLADGRLSGLLDTRLEVYRHNARRVPSVAGQVIPEPVFTLRAYREQILERIYADIAPLDPDGVLQHEWLNARGAIARFDRNTIEIRLLDIQECPRADLAILALLERTLRALVDGRFAPLAAQQDWEVGPLAAILRETIREAEQALICDGAYLRLFGLQERESCTAGELWRHLFGQFAGELAEEFCEPLEVISRHGTLARRILRALGSAPDRSVQQHVYGRLCECLAQGRMFLP